MMASDGFQFYLGSHHLALYARCHYAENMTSPIGTRQAFPPTTVLLWVIYRWPRHLDCMANLCYHLAAHTPLAIDGKEDMDLHKYLYCSKLTWPWRPLKASAKLQTLFLLFFASLMPFKRHKRAIRTKRQKTNCLCYAQSAFFLKSFFTYLRLKKTVKTQLSFKSDIIF